MGNAHGQHGDHSRKSSGNHGIHEGLVFDDKYHGHHGGGGGREMSPFDTSGPVDVLAPNQASPSRIGAPTRAHRPRATTESGTRRHILKDFPSLDLEVEKSEPKEPRSNKDGQKKMPTIIKFTGQGKEVFVCGTFNGWQKMRMSRSQKDFVAMVDLGEGDHEYKFFVDGHWVTDSTAPIIENDNGIKNNVIHVQKEDFDAFEALDMDSATVAKAQNHKAIKANAIRPQTCYGQEMPLFAQTAPGIPLTDAQRNQSGPPILPPHLLQVILNKDTPMSCEPTLLPEPNHVMLNHLYALSIKDGVMVLSTTQRFRKKYVTTLLYKPMGTRIPDEA